MTKIMFLGDSHGDVKFLEGAIRIAKKEECSQIIQVGDFGFFQQPEIPSQLLDGTGISMIAIEGNHDFYEAIDENVADLTKIAPGVMHAGRGSATQIGGLNILFLGGAFSIDKHFSMKWGRYWNSREEIKEEDVERAKQTIDRLKTMTAPGGPIVDVLVCHDGPFCTNQLKWLHENNSFNPTEELREGSLRSMKKVREVMDYAKPAILVHGHHHHAYTENMNGTTVVGLHCNHKPQSAFSILEAGSNV